MDNTLSYINEQKEEENTEMINGKVYMMSPRPRLEHGTVYTNIASEFRAYLKGKTCRAYGDGIDVFLDEKIGFVYY
ncbi:Uma2 family endonuclease [Megamonas hypermegale]|uniref:Uma2 family endonuclease n=1 Tax=Megamonas hypermegale TaxID=158847 RepID=UPI00195CBA25|nr:Uma2 family endonuclease [Megamonas hypermegale]MBM6761678.1 Uma2 family endonuclease [Megamonas hypermegale]